ncbi:unnamed protein product [Gemmataceae bacterium]|nr:unnamed protein product [Gemmataceae bacterium]VTT96547.1 unnamed protein product [Gemmataceae bacterium]
MTHLHQLVHAAVTSTGTRPRPTAPHAEALQAVPVRIALYHPGAERPFAVVACESFALHPHRPAGTDAGGNATPERQARCVLSCVVPPEVILDPHAAAAVVEESEPLELLAPPFDGSTPFLSTTAGRSDRTPTPAQKSAP